YLLQSLSGSAVSFGDTDSVKKNTSSLAHPAEPTNIEVKKTPVDNSKVIEYQQIEVKETKNTPPPAPPVKAPEPTPVTATKPAEIPIQSATPKPSSSSRKLSMNMLNDIETEVSKAAANREQEKKELTLEITQQLFEQYKQQLQAAGKNVI